MEELQFLIQALVQAGRLTVFKVNSYSQEPKLFNCAKCGCNGSSALLKAKEREILNSTTNKVSGGIQCLAQVNFCIGRMFCINCSHHSVRNTPMTIFETLELLKKYHEEHLLFKQNLPGQFERANSIQPKDYSKTKFKTRFSQKMKELNNSKISAASNISLQPSTTSSVESRNSVESFNSDNNNFTLDPVAALNLNTTDDDFAFNILRLPAEFEIIQIPPITMELLEPYDHHGRRAFNFGLINHLNSLPMGPVQPTPVSASTINPIDFLLLEAGAVPLLNINELLKTWLSFIAYTLRQSQVNQTNSIVLGGNIAYFESKVLPTFEWKMCATDDFVARMKEHMALLNRHVAAASLEANQLKTLFDTYLDKTMSFQKLFGFIFTPFGVIRPEAELFARYFFQFPDRIREMYNIDYEAVFLNIPVSELCAYRHLTESFLPEIYLTSKRPFARLTFKPIPASESL